MTHKLALIGFGVVGQGLAEILRDKADTLRDTLDFDAQIVAVSDLLKGAVYHPDGLDVAKLLEVAQSTGRLDAYPHRPGLERDWDSLKTISRSNADTIVEVSYTDIKTGQPAIDHCRAAFACGKNVVMSNKGPVALAYAELSALAEANGARWGFEGTVLSGTPALRMPLTALVGNQISEIRGIFNGTTNFILTQMEEEMEYAEALAQAQRLGYAEADPTADVAGYDARGKLVILANVIMNMPLRQEDVVCRGIEHLTIRDIMTAKAAGKRWKLIGRIKKEGDRIEASVGPEQVPWSDPLAGVMGAMNAVTYVCDLAGPVTLVGAGAGRVETGYALLIDLINIQRGCL
ncbi:MAG: homoserine dehydrogenase [Anaerolineae bacterium]|nr:homoserine dehydrogenase [Anaerolineae bacterium]